MADTDTRKLPTTLSGLAKSDVDRFFRFVIRVVAVLIALMFAFHYVVKPLKTWWDKPSRSATRTVTTTVAVSPIAHCLTGTTTTYPIGDGEVVVNRQGLCSTTIWYPPEGCVDMRRARSSVFEGPYGNCPGTKGKWGPNDMEAMRSSSGEMLTVDIALGPPHYH